MANDREVLRVIWEGQIPICFQADIDEANAVRQPENFYLMVSRLSYLPLVTDKVIIKNNIINLQKTKPKQKNVCNNLRLIAFRLKSISADMFQMTYKKVKFGLIRMVLP